ncbi:transposase family protein [Streptomyces sp. BR123]|uniref:transposase family protein n=1 Tax=Streptomyces sp. BR123 TaxID=2749828 RepID=UPI0015C42B34|nr:transposase family protein [Streptomyces sp. BR123]NXY93947.1 transposase family protein [Streptomyces sp. BR123]
MSKINVANLRPRSLLHWTAPRQGVPRPGRPRRRPPPSETRRGRPWTLLLDNHVLPAAIAWRTDLTHRQLADLFGVGAATVHRIIDRLTTLVAGLLEPPDGSRSDLWVVDGTLIPVEDQSQTKCSKNYRRSVNVQLVFRAALSLVPPERFAGVL